MKPFQIAGRPIGPEYPPYLVAEMSGNHGQVFDRAVRIIEAAAESGADAVKLQTYTPDTLTLDCDRACFRLDDTIWAGRTLHDLYREAQTPWHWQPKLQRIATDLGLTLFSTPFDATSVDFLETMDVPAYKIASFELIDPALLARVARTGKPILLSTGMATFDEIDEAVRTLRSSGADQLALLKCSSAYPATEEQMNLKALPKLASSFGTPVGLSDHSLSGAVPVAAVALGACIIEKHLTLSRADGGCDSRFSLEPGEFRQMAEATRAAHRALGESTLGPSEAETSLRRFRRSLFVVKDIRAGQSFNGENIRSLRPGAGLHPRHLDAILGQAATRDLEPGTPLEWIHVEGTDPL